MAPTCVPDPENLHFTVVWWKWRYFFVESIKGRRGQQRQRGSA